MLVVTEYKKQKNWLSWIKVGAICSAIFWLLYAASYASASVTYSQDFGIGASLRVSSIVEVDGLDLDVTDWTTVTVTMDDGGTTGCSVYADLVNDTSDHFTSTAQVIGATPAAYTFTWDPATGDFASLNFGWTSCAGGPRFYGPTSATGARLRGTDGLGGFVNPRITFTDDVVYVAPDTREAPSAFFYDPPDHRYWTPLVARDYTYRAAVDIDSNIYPDESVIFDYQVWNSLDEVVYDNPSIPFLLDNTYTASNISDSVYYAVTFNIPYVFEIGDYTLHIRAKTVTENTYGAWSQPLTLHITENGRPSCETGNIFVEGLCWIDQNIKYLVVPSEDSQQFLFDSADTISEVAPVQWIVVAATTVRSFLAAEPDCDINPTMMGEVEILDVCARMTQAGEAIQADEQMLRIFEIAVWAATLASVWFWLRAFFH